MARQRDILCLIPARGGSKGIPRKNVRKLCGKPLISYTIEAAQQADLGRVVVSTDDYEIASVSREFGLDHVLDRPSALASDTASSIDVVLHAVDQLYEERADCWVCLLQPTSPLRNAADIECAVELSRAENADVVSVCEARKPLSWYYRMDHDRRLEAAAGESTASRRQEAFPCYLPNGAIYVFAPEALDLEEPDLLSGSRGVVMPFERSVDIDDEVDWLLAEAIVTGSLAAVRQRLFDKDQ
jgi:CMP-N-acetylneuraminic acid synthetase